MTKNDEHQTGFWTRVEGVVAPRFCVGCRYRLSKGEQFVCTDCLQKTERTDFARHPTDNLMARMLWARTNVQRAATAFHYRPSSALSFAIQELKYNHKPELARYIGQLAAKELIRSDFLEDIDAFVPVPITRERCLERGYNQSLLIAEGMRDVTGIPIHPGRSARAHILPEESDTNEHAAATNERGRRLPPRRRRSPAQQARPPRRRRDDHWCHHECLLPGAAASPRRPRQRVRPCPHPIMNVEPL